jgi:hypothetical protein
VLKPLRVEVGARITTIRAATLADVDALLDHYERLTAEDLRRRFLSTFAPQRAFVENWVRRSEDGGLVLIALEDKDASRERVVADAGFVPSGPDTAEFAMTVAADRRGWLGPFLLDVLVEQAREHGVAVLTAEMLATNAGMLALLRSRGCAFRPSEDPSILEVVIGTAGRTPVWPVDSPRPRVLIEGSAMAWPGSRLAGRAGLSVLACPGPGHGRSHPCPVLHGQRCPLLDDADALVVALPPDAPTTRPLLEAHLASPDARPVALVPALDDIAAGGFDDRSFPLDTMATPTVAIAALRRVIGLASPHASPARDDGQDPELESGDASVSAARSAR